MNCIQFWLTWHDNLTVIFSVVAIIITIIISGGQSGQARAVNDANTKKKHNFIIRILVAVIVLAVAVVISGKSLDKHNVWTIVPNLYGRTYDDAMSILYEHRLNGQLALASTNNDLSDSDSRIVWQSYEEGKPIKVGTTISFLIDDRFSLDSIPLNQYAYKDESIIQSKKLEYKIIDNKDAVKQAVEREEAAKENNTSVDYSYDDPHWDVGIKAADIWYDAYTTIWGGRAYVGMNATYSYNVYAGSMSLTLEELVEKSANTLTGGIGRPDLDTCFVVGKLIPVSGQESMVLYKINVPNDNDKCVFFLPQTLSNGEYKFVFSIIDSNYKMFEWYHNISIVEEFSAGKSLVLP